MNRNEPRDDFDIRIDNINIDDISIDAVLRYALAIGAVLVLLLPAARGFNQTVGWLPLWLLVMPAAALWALHRFRLPRRNAGASSSAPRRRRALPLARRRLRAGPLRAVPRAA